MLVLLPSNETEVRSPKVPESRVGNETEVSTPKAPQSHVDVNSFVLEQAQELQASMPPDYPTFLKPLCRSHLSGKFDLALPRKFCEEHLPHHDGNIILVDENEQECSAKFSVHRSRVFGGWKDFSISHDLQEGDVLIFQLIEPWKFKVYTVRSRNFLENDKGNGYHTRDLQNNTPVDIDNEVVAKEVNEEGAKEETTTNGKRPREKYVTSPAEVSPQVNKKARLLSESKSATDPSDNTTNYVGTDEPEDGRNPESVVYFNDIKCLEDFRIQVDGRILDSEVPAEVRIKYYELCCCQRMFLHENLIEGLNMKLAIAVISEIIDIADAIRAVESPSSVKHLESWDKTLKAFEDLGMAVGFLRTRIDKLLAMCRESQLSIDSKRSEKAEAKNELRCLKEKAFNVKAWIQSLNREIDDLIAKNGELNIAIKKIASASW